MSGHTVGRLAVTWRTDAPPDATDRARVDALVRELGEDVLPGVLEDRLATGSGTGSEICVRHLDAPGVRLDWAVPDGEMVQALARAVDQAVTVALAAPDEVVRYRSREQARQDLVLSLLDGRWERSWAWRLLGLWADGSTDPSGPQGDGYGGHDTAERLRTALRGAAGTAGAASALVTAVAVAGRLPDLVTTVGRASLVELADGAWRAAGETPGGPRSVRRDTGPAVEAAVVDDTADVLAEAVVARSSVASAAAGTALATDPSLRRALAVLAVLEAEPAVVLGGRAERVVTRVDALLEPAARSARARTDEVATPAAPPTPGPPADERPPDGSPTAHAPLRPDPTDATSPEDGSARREGTDGSTAARADGSDRAPDRGDVRTPAAHQGTPDSTDHGTGLPAAGRPDPRPDPRPDGLSSPATEPAGRPGPALGAPSPPSAPVPQPDAADPPTDRDATPWAPGTTVAATSWAGLLFVLPLLDELGLPARWAAGATVGSTRSALHTVAVLLLRRAAAQVPGARLPAATDPAALAFAGLAPDADPPDPVSAAVRTALAADADDVVGALADRVDPAAADPDAVLARVCRRDGVVEADPAWIDVVLDLDGVDVDVRRAGLDLDPGYLPWLGAVVRFRYA